MMDVIVKGVYFWALRWSKFEGFSLYETLVYTKQCGFPAVELVWLEKYIIGRK